MASYTERMIGAAKLDVKTYEEVERDQTALGQALGVVVLSSLAAGIGSLGSSTTSGVVVAIVLALVGWFLWALVVFLVGTKLLPEPGTSADLGELLRTTGFAAAPGILRVAGIVPMLGRLVVVIVAFWMLAAMIVAVRQALDYRSTGRAIGVVVVGWICYVLVGVVLSVMGMGLAL